MRKNLLKKKFAPYKLISLVEIRLKFKIFAKSYQSSKILLLFFLPGFPFTNIHDSLIHDSLVELSFPCIFFSATLPWYYPKAKKVKKQINKERKKERKKGKRREEKRGEEKKRNCLV